MTRAGRALGAAVALLMAVMGPAAAFDLPWRKPQAEAAAPPRPVVTEILAETSRDARSVPGVIAARTQVNLGFQTLGRLVSRSAEIGDLVQKDQVLARLDPEDLASNVRAAEAGLQAARVQLSTAQSSAARARELARRNVASQAQLEQAEQALVAAQAAADQAHSELIRAEDAAGFAEIRAPFAGIVSAVYENAGAVVEAGAPVLQLSQAEEREAVIDLPETAVASLPPEAAFTVWQEAGGERDVGARIDRIEPIADTATRMRRVHLALDAEAGFRLGALIRARPAAGTGGQVMTLPAAAVFDEAGTRYVWRVERGQPQGDVAPDGIVHRTPVKTGMLLGGRVTIISGLEPSAEIVIRGVHSLTDGQAVGRRVEP